TRLLWRFERSHIRDFSGLLWSMAHLDGRSGVDSRERGTRDTMADSVEPQPWTNLVAAAGRNIRCDGSTGRDHRVGLSDPGSWASVSGHGMDRCSAYPSCDRRHRLTPMECGFGACFIVLGCEYIVRAAAEVRMDRNQYRIRKHSGIGRSDYCTHNR